MFKSQNHLMDRDPVYAENGGFGGIALEELHADVSKFELPGFVPAGVRRSHDAIRHAYVYSYFSYDLLTLAASQVFPCLELALRERIGDQWRGRTYASGKPRPPQLYEMLDAAKAQGLISIDIGALDKLRNIFAHGSDAILDPNMFLDLFEKVTFLIWELYTSSPKTPPLATALGAMEGEDEIIPS